MSTAEEDLHVDVVIVGAGLSGLAAAYHLIKRDPSIRLLVLEANDRVGGRTLTKQLKAAKGYDSWDLGGQWVGKTQLHIISLIEDLGLQTYPQFTDGKKFQKLGGDEVKTYLSDIPPLPLISLIDLDLFMKKIDRYALQVPVDDPYQCPMAEEWDNMTFDTFIKQNMWTKDASNAFNVGSRVVYGSESSQMSALFSVYYTRTAGGIMPLFGATENDAQGLKVKGGCGQISKLLVDQIGAQNVLLSHPVRSVKQTDDNVIITTSQRSIHCSRVIMAVPPQQAGRLQYTPPLPADKIVIFNRMCPGHYVKFIITYKKAFWKEAGYSGEIVSDGGRTAMEGCDTGPLSVIFDATTSDGNPALLGFITGKQAVQWMVIDSREREGAVVADLAEFLGPEALDYITYIEKDWSEEPYEGGAPVSACTPGIMSSFASGLRMPFQRLHFAGTESATMWPGYMSGAVQAGTRAANEVLFHLRPQSVTDEDLKETAYGPKDKKNKPRPSRSFAVRAFGLALALGFAAVLIAAGRQSHFRIAW